MEITKVSKFDEEVVVEEKHPMMDGPVYLLLTGDTPSPRMGDELPVYVKDDDGTGRTEIHKAKPIAKEVSTSRLIDDVILALGTMRQSRSEALKDIFPDTDPTHPKFHDGVTIIVMFREDKAIEYMVENGVA